MGRYAVSRLVLGFAVSRFDFLTTVSDEVRSCSEGHFAFDDAPYCAKDGSKFEFRSQEVENAGRIQALSLFIGDPVEALGRNATRIYDALFESEGCPLYTVQVGRESTPRLVAGRQLSKIRDECGAGGGTIELAQLAEAQAKVEALRSVLNLEFDPRPREIRLYHTAALG